MPQLETSECDCDLCSPTRPTATIRPRPPAMTFMGRTVNPFMMTYAEIQSVLQGNAPPPSRNDDRWYVPPEKGSET